MAAKLVEHRPRAAPTVLAGGVLVVVVALVALVELVLVEVATCFVQPELGGADQGLLVAGLELLVLVQLLLLLLVLLDWSGRSLMTSGRDLVRLRLVVLVLVVARRQVVGMLVQQLLLLTLLLVELLLGDVLVGAKE